jgi:diguanylate cyclase (GGDEF)-like protein
MVTQRKTVAFLTPAILLFISLNIWLFRLPSQYPLIVLLFLAFVLSTAALISIDIASVCAVFVTMAELVGVAFVPGEDKLWIVGQIPLVWLAVYVSYRFLQREKDDESRRASGLRERQQALLSVQKEKDSLEKRLTELDGQASLRQHLFNAVHNLASLLDPVMIRQRLMEFVRATIGRGTIHYFAGSVPRDLMDKWVMERKLPLLVTDVLQDSRFKPSRAGVEVRSVLAAPMIVERQLVGIIRLNGFEPELFSVSDLRIVEALSLLASLALENLQLLARLEESATKDNLTGLYTHRFFQERLADEILRAGRYQTEFCLLLLDIDHFKRYNDTYGHAAGDQVLVRFSQVLQQHARPVDIVARYGGEEFVLILPQTTPADARQVAESIRQSISSHTFNFGSEATMNERVTVSIGVSNFPNEATTSSQLVRVADYRLYQAKEGGRNQVIG